MSHSNERPGMGSALGKFCKLRSSQCLDIAFQAFEKDESQTTAILVDIWRG